MPEPLTACQQSLLELIQERMADDAMPPTCREICSHFGYKSPKAATDLLDQLEKKGWITRVPGRARNIRLTQSSATGVPFLGSIPAGVPVDSESVQDTLLNLNPAAFGIRDRRLAFALRADGDSMIGRHIYPGDIVVFEAKVIPRPENIVAALIDQKSTLKTFVQKGGKSWLRAENPRYPDLEPAWDLQIQGVARGVIRFLR